MEDVILRGEQLVKTFGRGHTEVRAVDGVSIEIARGELVLIMGPSGSGKTTLISMLGGLLKPSSGRIFIDDTDITGLDERKLPAIRAKKLGFVFQAFNLLEALTVEENILFPAQLVAGGIAGARTRASKLIEAFGLGPRRRSLPRTLSGGEKQRVAIARALINKPPIILADEPTGNLDSNSGQEVIMALHDIARDEGRSVILVTHDPRVEDVADRVMWLEDGAFRDRKREEHLWVRDPVCGMRVDEWTAEIATTYANRRIVFCSRRCLKRFETSPEIYISKTESHDDSGPNG